MNTHATLPVIAAIPNYNMAKGLKRLLPQLLKQGYEHIYVLDDCSTDKSEAIVRTYGKKVTFVKSDVNRGASAARNQIIPYLNKLSLVHFIDADIEPVSKNIPVLINNLGIDEHVGFTGGLVLEEGGKQTVWNYGYQGSLKNSILGILISLGARPRQYPNPSTPPARKEVFWVIERSIVIRSDTFIRLGGFDPAIREHDIQPLAHKAKKAGLKSYFDPSFVIRSHNDINVRPYNRLWALIKAEYYVNKTYSNAKAWWLSTKDN